MTVTDIDYTAITKSTDSSIYLSFNQLYLPCRKTRSQSWLHHISTFCDYGWTITSYLGATTSALLFTASCKEHREVPKCRKKEHEALETIQIVAGCAYNNLISMIGLSYRLQTFQFRTCSKKCILSVGRFPNKLRKKTDLSACVGTSCSLMVESKQ